MKKPTRFARIQIFSFFLTGLWVFSCGKSEEGPVAPERLVGEEQMVEALVAIHILEQQLNDLRIPKQQKLDSFRTYQQRIFGRLSIDSVAYYQSYEYYASPQQIEQMQQIMLEVTDSLSTLREQYAPN